MSFKEWLKAGFAVAVLAAALTSKQLVGVVIVEDLSCAKCVNASELLRVAGLENASTRLRVVDVSSQEGASLVERYGLRFAPSMIISPEGGRSVEEKLLMNGFKASDGYYVLDKPPLPYKDLRTGETRGLVDVTYITADCECYSLEELDKRVFGTFKAAKGRSESYDYQSRQGKELIERYGLKAVPTAIFTGDLDAYPRLGRAWLIGAGTIERDGAYVFRNTKLMKLWGGYLEVGKD